jgi:NAD(P)-dependent dehydrogenase (short-subunit alcohol dehydrogenase family)
MEIAGRAVIITGGAGPGCGSAIARRFAAGGAKVVVADIDDAGGEALARELSTIFVHTDIADASQINALVETAQRAYGPLGALVNNASYHPHSGDPLQEWTDVLAVDVNGMLALTRYAIDAMTDGGAITNVGSTSSLSHGRDRMHWPIYDIAKIVPIRAATALAPALAPLGIRINCVVPHWIGTPELLAYVAALTPEERNEHGVPPVLARPEAIADAIFTLATDDRLNGRLLVFDEHGVASLMN